MAFTNVSAGRLIQLGGPRVGNPSFKGLRFEDVEWIQLDRCVVS